MMLLRKITVGLFQQPPCTAAPFTNVLFSIRIGPLQSVSVA